LSSAGLAPAERNADGLVEMLLDATARFDESLSEQRLYGWQAALFPTGYSGLHRVQVGAWRTGKTPMRVVSGPVGRERVHFQAPPSTRVGAEMARLLRWWPESRGALDGLLRAGLAHLWLVTIHPFEDGNGRVARALADMALAQDERTGTRLYSMSAQISTQRDDYYQVLERTQRGGLEVTEWLSWFLRCLNDALGAADFQIEQALARSRFWQNHLGASLSERQLKAVNRLLDSGPGGFEGGLTTRKYVSMTRASRATAQRELSELVSLGFLRRRPGGGRNASYELAWQTP
jgi:Fic family protein